MILVYLQDQINGSTISLDCTAAPGHISHLAVAGVGLWVASSATSNVALYHTESFIHMQVRMVNGENEEKERERANDGTCPLMSASGLLPSKLMTCWMLIETSNSGH